MSKRANPTLIGIFVLGAIALAVVTILLVAGGEWFQEKRQHVMYFEGAAQGLQVGAPVVFLGVKVGTVKRIQLGLDEQSRMFVVPVTIEVEPAAVQTRSGQQVDLRDRQTIKQLVDRGLRARLKMQSLLTGQLYVDLDFYPDKPARFFALDANLSEIPTIPTTVDELSSRLEGFPMDKFLMNVAEIGESVNKILSSTAARELPLRLETTLNHLESLATKLDARAEPILEDLRTDLIETRKALATAKTAVASVGAAADRVGNAADQVGGLAERVDGLTSADSQPFKNMTRASEELAAAAQAVRGLTEEESPTIQGLNATLREMARAASALRLLAETLEQQPGAILRGKRLGGEE